MRSVAKYNNARDDKEDRVAPRMNAVSYSRGGFKFTVKSVYVEYLPGCLSYFLSISGSIFGFGETEILGSGKARIKSDANTHLRRSISGEKGLMYPISNNRPTKES